MINKKALCVGINSYTAYPLKGCVNDAVAMSEYLTGLGFTVNMCIDKFATYNAILTSLKKLVSDVRSGDTVVFYYSGHGSQVPDIDGDESDGFDECLCPVNIDFHKGNYITDDELYSLFSTIPISVNIEVILDCCHSGSGLRSINKHAITKNYPCDDSVTRSVVQSSRAPVKKYQKNGLNSVFWSACGEGQTSVDVKIEDSYRGAFTYSLLCTLSKGVIDRSTLIEHVCQDLAKSGWKQVPTLECSVDKCSQYVFNETCTTRDVGIVKEESNLLITLKNVFKRMVTYD